MGTSFVAKVVEGANFFAVFLRATIGTIYYRGLAIEFGGVCSV